MLSQSQLAVTIARILDGDDSQAQLINRQLKNLVSRQLVEPSEHRGGRRDAFFNERDACKAIIMIALVRAGLDALTLRSCGPAWHEATFGTLEGLPAGLNGYVPPRAIDAMIYDLRHNPNRRWDFQLIVRRKMSDGNRVIYANLVREGEPDPPETEPRSLAGPNADGVIAREGTVSPEGDTQWRTTSPLRTLAVITVPATELTLDLLSE